MALYATRTKVPWLRTLNAARTAPSAFYHDYVRFSNPNGSGRIPLHSPKIIGTATSRGIRGYQEDFFSFVTLSLDPEELRLTVKKRLGIEWDPTAVGEPLSRQAVFVGIYDGHGGSAVSQYLRQELHGIFESVNKSMIPETYEWVKEIGGYFRRWKGGVLAPWALNPGHLEELDLEARATLAFFEVDRHLAIESDAKSCGATASVAILHSLDAPATPFFASERVALTIAHCGDTRALLCATDGGQVHPMTEVHHADGRVESARLRRMMGSSLITDSYGESRWMGTLANTRALGDLRFKPFGVTAEPEVHTKLLERGEWAFLVLLSDGISSVVSDDEVVDLARGARDPRAGAQAILSYAEELGVEDNATALVVPLSGWSHVRGPDKTKDLRAYRREQSIGSERQRRM